jgi:hypothetical protein
MFGWIEIVKEYALIHPDLFRALDLFFGTSKFSKDKKLKGRETESRKTCVLGSNCSDSSDEP